MKLTMKTPLDWRKGWTLHRSTEWTDERGNPRRSWNMESPDFSGEADTASGVCWQIRNHQWALEQFGEQAQGGAEFDLFLSELEIRAFDRCIFGGCVWEVRSVVEYSNHRHVALVEVKVL